MYRALYVTPDDARTGDLVCCVPLECGTELKENSPLNIIRFIVDVLAGEQWDTFTVDFESMSEVQDSMPAKGEKENG
jgi:hypothetical protein